MSMEPEELFRLCHETGEVFWRVRRGPVAPGQKAGTFHSDGYLRVRFNRRIIPVHHVVWRLVHGSWPTLHLDHKDGDRSNNRPSNLREANRFQNHRNCKISSANTSGYKGVSKMKHGKWKAQIRDDGRSKYLGTFDTAELASEAYWSEAQRLFGEFARFR